MSCNRFSLVKMKRTQFIELLNNIKTTIVAFISITMFVALGVCVYVGLGWVSEGIIKMFDDPLNDTNYQDIEILFPYGMDDEDLDKLLELDGVDEVEGSYTGYAFINLNETRYQAKLVQVRDNISKPYKIIEGRLPKSFDELAMDFRFAEKYGLKIGDTITFNEDNDGSSRSLIRIVQYDSDYSDINDLTKEDENLMANLKTNEFKIVGIATNPEFLNVNQNTYGVAVTNGLPINCFVYLNKEAFDEESFLGYPDVLIRSNSLREYTTFSDEYKEKVNILTNYIKNNAADEIAANKCEEIRNSIDGVKTGAQNKLNNAWNQIVSGNNRIASAKNQLSEGEDQLSDGKDRLQGAESTISSLQSEFDKINGEYNSIVSTYNKLKEAVAKGADYIESTPEEIISYINTLKNAANKIGLYTLAERLQVAIDYINAGSYQDATDLILSLLSNIDEIVNEYNKKLSDAANQVSSAKSLISLGWDSYNIMKDQYDSKVKEVESAERSLKNAKSQYNNGKKLLDEFNEKVNDIPEYGCTLLSRNYNAALLIGVTMSDMMANLKYSMAMLFVIVGLLVCYSSLSRIVNDQITAIGTKKALGLTRQEITINYLAYTAFATVIGCVLGNIMGVAVIESIMIKAINGSFNCDLGYYFSLKQSIPICAIEIVLLLIITYFACRKVLKRDAVKLLAGPADVEGKTRFYEKFKVWQKLSLFTKTIINNCFNEKRRVIGTIIGIAGSTALIVTALTMRNNVLNSFEIQYNDYFHFDTIISYDPNVEDASKNIRAYLESNNIQCADVYYSRLFTKTPDDMFVSSQIFVPDDYNEFDKMVTIKPDSRKNKNSVDEGYWMCASYKNYFDIPSDEPVNLVSLSGKEVKLVPNGYFPFYLTAYQMVMDKNTYYDNFEEEVQMNSFIINTNGLNRFVMEQDLREIDGFVSLFTYYINSKGSFDEFQKVSMTMVIIYFVLAVIMAFLVSLNLLNMFIDEKKKELIVLMINGYSISAAKKYIYSDTVFLTFISVIVGIFVGTYVGDKSVTALESLATSFVRGMNFQACLYGVLGSILLTFIVCVIALTKIKRFKLTDINKF